MRLYCVLFLNSLLMAVPSFASDGEITLDLLPDSTQLTCVMPNLRPAVMYDFMRTFNGRDVRILHARSLFRMYALPAVA